MWLTMKNKLDKNSFLVMVSFRLCQQCISKFRASRKKTKQFKENQYNQDIPTNFRVYHIEMDETKWLWWIEGSIILLNYGA